MNHLPDLIYASVTFEGPALNELYGVRRRIKKCLNWRKEYMEDLAARLAVEFPDALEVTVRLAFSRHIVSLMRE